MKMIVLTNHKSWLLAALGLGLLASPASAYICGIQGSATAQAGVYDPFGSTGLPTTRITLDMQRLNPAGGGKTATVGFYLTAAANQNADYTDIRAVSFGPAGAVNVFGLNQNIFYNVGATTPNMVLGNNVPVGYVQVEFSGNNVGSDYLTVTFDVTLPPNSDVAADQNLYFNVNYLCGGTGGGHPFEDTGVIPNALSFPIKILSGLQASYSGHVFDFEDVGNKTNADILAAQMDYTKSGWVNVRSSGAYIVTLASEHGYRMTFPAGDANNPLQSLNYSATFAGQKVNSGTGAFVPVSCTRAGLGVKQIPLTVELNDGGKDKAPSDEYQDILTITVSPDAGGVTGLYPCAIP